MLMIAVTEKELGNQHFVLIRLRKELKNLKELVGGKA